MIIMIWLASYPRSGNTLYRLVLHQVYGVPTYSLYMGDILINSGIAGLIGHRLYTGEAGDIFVKTHELPFDDFHPAIYIVRDGRDAVVSYAAFMKNHESPDADFNRMMRHVIASNNWGGWCNNVKAWTSRPNTRIVMYENLIEDPIGVVKRCIDWLGLDWEPVSDTVPSFEELHGKFPIFFREGKVGAWRNHMPKKIEEKFWTVHGDTMKQIGYRR